MGILWFIVLGLVVGLLAKWIMPGRDPGGIVVTCLLGIAGALLGSFAGSRLGFSPLMGFNLKSLALSTAGAVVLLILYRVVRRRS